MQWDNLEPLPTSCVRALLKGKRRSEDNDLEEYHLAGITNPLWPFVGPPGTLFEEVAVFGTMMRTRIIRVHEGDEIVLFERIQPDLFERIQPA